MKHVGEITIAVIVGLLRAYTLFLVWNWLITPLLKLPEISFIGAFSVLVVLMVMRRPQERIIPIKEQVPFATQMIEIVLGLIIVIGEAYILKQFI